MPLASFRESTPFVTVHSGRSYIDPAFAPCALIGYGRRRTRRRAALEARPYLNALDQDALVNRIGGAGVSTRGAYSVHAEVTMPGGNCFVRDAIVDLRGVSERRGFVIRG